VALERQSIEKKDFPIGRRGYDPEAVDAHLKGLADEVEALRGSTRRRSETLASTASDQVRAIVEAAETSAAEIQRQAEQEAQEIRSEASVEAQSTREEATAQAQEYVGKVSESTAAMLQRLDAMESELGALVESLRTGSNRLNADLQLLETNLADVRESVAPSARFEPGSRGEPELALETEPGGAVEPPPAELAPDEVAEPAVALEGEEVLAIEVEEVLVEDAGASANASEAAEDGGDDTEGARLIALNMALNGTPRDETERYLAENFELADRDGLLDEVYASVEG
jgi:DivIVA domain-containing protein